MTQPEPTGFGPDGPDLGTCCICGGSRKVTILVQHDLAAPTPGKGWGCVVCGAPANGAISVICKRCFPSWYHNETQIRLVCEGYPSEAGRVPIEQVTEPFTHFSVPHQ